MTDLSFKETLFISFFDKGFLAIVVAYAGYKANKSLEGIKNRLIRQQDFYKTVDAAIIDLTKNWQLVVTW